MRIPNSLKLSGRVPRPRTRSGLSASLNIQSGCGDPGNPNIANDNGLKKIVTAKATVSGPGKVDIKLPMPLANAIFYQDIMIWVGNPSQRPFGRGGYPESDAERALGFRA